MPQAINRLASVPRLSSHPTSGTSTIAISPDGDSASPALVTSYPMSCCMNCGSKNVTAYNDAYIASTITQQNRKFLSFSRCRFTTGFFALSSHTTAAIRQTTAITLAHVINVDPNQSSSCPRSSTISSAASPTEINPSPTPSI